jgi:hypothetical protein
MPNKKIKRGRGTKGGRKYSWRYFGRILLQVAEKGPKKFAKEVPYLTAMTNTRGQRLN